MRDRLDWATDGSDWPNRSASRFITAGGLQWHVQQFGPDDANDHGSDAGSVRPHTEHTTHAGTRSASGSQGLHDRRVPSVLLLHGTGSSSHSWRDVAPLLAQRCRILAPDLPGHAFTSLPAPLSGQSLAGMAHSVGALIHALQFVPDLIVGHSAGAAIAAQMVLDGHARPAALVSLNGAFVGFGGWAGALFSPLARLMASGQLVARYLARQGSDIAVVRRLLDGTGSVLDERGVQLYARLLQSPGHVKAALAMMAHWDLGPLGAALPRLAVPVWLVAAGHDLTVPPSQAAMVASRLQQAIQLSWPQLGHLAHEERPDLCVQLLADVLHAAGLD